MEVVWQLEHESDTCNSHFRKDLHGWQLHDDKIRKMKSYQQDMLKRHVCKEQSTVPKARLAATAAAAMLLSVFVVILFCSDRP